jgi:ATP-dependent exoDNAse (exonuclease V) beta subunit
MNQPQGSVTFSNLVIRASAGTGKTFQLSNRFLALLRARVPCDRILATTFTRKAAGEILDRLISRLAEAAEDDEKLAGLGRSTGDRPISRDACLRLLEHTMQSLHRLRVSTLDSFFSQVARSFGLELGLPPGWQIVEEIVDARLRSRAIEAVLAGGDSAKLRTLVNLLTKGEATRSVSQLIRDAVDGLYGLLLETDEAAWRKVPRDKPLDEPELAATLEALRTAELPGGALRKARDEDYDRAVQGQWEEWLKKGLAAKVAQGKPEYLRKPIPGDVVALYERLIGHVKADLVGRVALQTQATFELLQLFHTEYQRLKRSHRSLRFEDVTRQLAAIGTSVDLASLAYRLDSRIDHLLLDEFQDTSPQQWRVIRPLAERLAEVDVDGSFFCVGDVKQAIYGWRGGVAEIFDALDRQLENLQEDRLNVSYRSAQPIIDAVNQVFTRITEHPNLGRSENAVRRWCDRFEPQQTARAALAGYVQLASAPRAGEGQNQQEVTIRFAAEKIAEIVRQAPGHSVGVLVRKNETLAKLIYELRNLHVAASEEGGNPLTDSAAVMTVLSLLRMADHPGDTVARFHLAHSPLGRVIGLADHRDDAAARTAAQQVRQRLLREGYGASIYAWTESLAAHCNRRELSRLQQLVELAYAYDVTATLRTDDFVRYVESTRVADPTAADVRVMTIHQAKGLQFNIVVLPELDADLVGQNAAVVIDRPDVTGCVACVCRYANASIQQLMPPSLQKMFDQATDRAVTESLCVLYVAMTRAIHALHAVISPSSPSEKTLPRTFAGLLRVTLRDAGPAPPETILYEHGDGQWYRHPGRVTAAEPARVPPSAGEPAEGVVVQLAPATGTRRRGWERARPSGLEGGSRVPLGQVLTASRSRATLRGELIHAWLERVGWLEDDRPDPETLRRVAQEVLAGVADSELDIELELVRFAEFLDSPPAARMLRRERYRDLSQCGFASAVAVQLANTPFQPTVHPERGFAIRDGDQLLTGFIDRLVLLKADDRVAAAEVIDYKTDAISAGDAAKLAQRVAFYAPQLRAYRRAVAHVAALPEERIAATLFFVETGDAVSVEE